MTPVSPAFLVRLGRGAAIFGGGLRILTGLIPLDPGSAWMEAVYAVIDLSLLVGLVGIYLPRSGDLGWAGLAFALTAGAGLASIVGPDAIRFDIDFYALGSSVTVLGVAGLAIQGLRGRCLGMASMAWLTTLGLGGVAAMTGSALPLQAAGLAFGLGFVLAGASGAGRGDAQV